MNFNFDREKTVAAIKSALSYVFIVAALLLGFTVGRYTQDYPPKKETVQNPYATPLKSSEVSIAVDESNNLMIIERASGKYVMYSDEVGISVFKMYTNRIYQKATDNE